MLKQFKPFLLAGFSLSLLAACHAGKKNTTDPTVQAPYASTQLWSEITKAERSGLNIPDTFTTAFSIWKLDTTAMDSMLNEIRKKSGKKILGFMPNPQNNLREFSFHTYDVIPGWHTVIASKESPCAGLQGVEDTTETGFFCRSGREFTGLVVTQKATYRIFPLYDSRQNIYFCSYVNDSTNTFRDFEK